MGKIPSHSKGLGAGSTDSIDGECYVCTESAARPDVPWFALSTTMSPTIGEITK
jgi:hypothetical protein